MSSESSHSLPSPSREREAPPTVKSKGQPSTELKQMDNPTTCGPDTSRTCSGIVQSGPHKDKPCTYRRQLASSCCGYHKRQNTVNFNNPQTWPKNFTKADIINLVSPQLKKDAEVPWDVLFGVFQHDGGQHLATKTFLDTLLGSSLDYSLEALFEKRPKFALQGLKKKKKAQDMVAFAQFVHGLVTKLRMLDGPEIQKCLSVVLRSASGVGKTFATFALTHALRNLSDVSYFPIALYMGFSTEQPLTEEEKRRIQAGQLELVLLRRLLFQLSFLESDVNIDDSLWDSSNNLQMMPVPTDGWSSCEFFIASDQTELAHAKVVDLLTSISEKAGGPVVLFPIVDEGQFLDTCCPQEHGSVRGARRALQLFRALQLRVLQGNSGNMLLGIMTGIDPNVSLSHATEGKNASYGEALHDYDGFEAITKELLHEQNYEPRLEKLVAATLFPYIRDVELFACGFKLSHLGFAEGTTPAYIHELMVATARKRVVSLPWQVVVPAAFVEGDMPPRYTPVMGVRLFMEAARLLKEKSKLSPFLDPPSSQELMSHITSADSNAFEHYTPFCLSVLMYFTNMIDRNLPAQPEGDSEGISDLVRKWLEVDTERITPLSFHFSKPLRPNQVSFPSSVSGSHKVAFATEAGPPLHTTFTSNVESLDRVGDTVIFLCGGRAPVDVICVTLGLPVGVKKCLQIRLCDAKHVSTDKGILQSDTIQEMFERFSFVKKFVEHHLSAGYDLTFKPPAIVATGMHDEPTVARKPNAGGRTVVEGTISAEKKEKKEEATDGKTVIEEEEIVLISPASCKFPPLTNWWFAAERVKV